MLGISLFILGLLVLVYHERSAFYYSLWGFLGCWYASFHAPITMTYIAWMVWAIWLLLFQLSFLRRHLLTPFLLRRYQQVYPKLSTTEAEALAAGTVGWDGELFSGNPHWQALWEAKLSVLSAEEMAFLKGPVEALCAQMAQYPFLAAENDMPAEIWNTLRTQGFFGLHIPKEYGGLGFSKTATATILGKIASCSSVLASMASVPNSLGPAELLLEYGTTEQRNYYLPRLAKGIEVPCFALTSPEAGSDASAMPDYGIVTQGQWQGQSVIGIKVTWNKRYITLAPKATLLGLAFKLYDPDHLLGETVHIGITCALIPVDHPGVIIGRRHFVNNALFINGPTSGNAVFIPLEWIIGGIAQKGRGWRMLTESLSAGRAMALPGLSLGGLYALTLASSAYASIRTQFKLPIGKFEGVQEKLALMALSLYQTEVITHLTLSAVDRGEKPSVLSAIVKYYATESVRAATQAAMDVQGGKGICMGPRNYLSDAYQSTSVGITVEGANILTRNMIIFGQGAVRCHPYINTCLEAVNMSDPKQALFVFDKAIWGHIAHFISLWPRIIFQSITGGWLIWPERHAYKRALQKLSLRSTRFAFLSEICFLVYGSHLKFAERVSARMADMLIHLYIVSGILKYNADGLDTQLWTLAMAKSLNEAAIRESVYAIDKASAELLNQLPTRFLAKLLSALCLPWGRKRAGISDKQKSTIAKKLLMNTAMVQDIRTKVYSGEGAESLIANLMRTHQEAVCCEPLYQKIKPISANHPNRLEEAVQQGLITEAECTQLRALEQAIADIIAVDDFSAEAFSRT